MYHNWKSAKFALEKCLEGSKYPWELNFLPNGMLGLQTKQVAWSIVIDAPNTGCEVTRFLVDPIGQVIFFKVSMNQSNDPIQKAKNCPCDEKTERKCEDDVPKMQSESVLT